MLGGRSAVRERRSNSAVVLATESHRNDLLASLRAEGFDMETAIQEGRYISVGAADTLSTFMVNDLPDPRQFLEVAGDLMAAAAKAAKHGRVAACGECAPLLWTRRNAEAAIQVEKLWNQVAKTYDMDILCGYSLDSIRSKERSREFQRIRAEHSAMHSYRPELAGTVRKHGLAGRS
jgi:hypothetical protein